MANNYFESETPHFFKVILQEDLQKNSLMVPRKFVRKYGMNLSNLVHLKCPSGDVSAVELERDGDEGLSLRKGWADFMDRCCIRFGYFLVFRYEGDSRFHVVVFDVTACEIEYPLGPGIGKGPSPSNGRPLSSPEAEKADCEDLDACETSLSHGPFSSPGVAKTGEREDGIIEELSCDEGFDAYANSGKKKPPSPCHRPTKKLRVEPRVMNAARAESDHSSPERGEFVKAAVSAKKSGAYLRAASFRCEGPSTIVVIRSLVRLYLPKTFRMTCFSGSGKSGDIKVCLSDGRTWTFRISKERLPRFGRGWHKFIVDNNLRAGDVCLFELMESAEALFRVVIFREECVEHPHPTPPRQRVVSSQENAMRKSANYKGSRGLNYSAKLDSGNKIRDPYPFFLAVASKSYERHSLHIPKCFADRHLKSIMGKVDVDVTLEHGGNSWPGKLLHFECQGRRQTSLQGWLKFRRENGFKIGDALRFELVNQENEFIFRVSNL